MPPTEFFMHTKHLPPPPFDCAIKQAAVLLSPFTTQTSGRHRRPSPSGSFCYAQTSGRHRRPSPSGSFCYVQTTVFVNTTPRENNTKLDGANVTPVISCTMFMHRVSCMYHVSHALCIMYVPCIMYHVAAMQVGISTSISTSTSHT